MSRQFDLVRSSQVDGALSNRNLIINGAMQVWQRGTSQSTGGYGSVDRWQVVNITSSSRQTDVPSGFQYSILLETSTPNFPFIAQKWESVNVQHLSGADITLTFWAKSVSGTASIFAEYLTANSVDNYSAVTARGNKSWANPSTSWTKYEYTFTNVNAAVLNGLEIRIGMQNQSSGSIAITGVQLEVGDTATPFEHRSYSQELALCERYLQELPVGPSAYAATTLYDGTVAVVHLRQVMRATPTLLPTGITGWGGGSTEYAVYIATNGGGGFLSPPTTALFYSDFISPSKIRIVCSHAPGWWNSSFEHTGSFIDVGTSCKILFEAEL